MAPSKNPALRLHHILDEAEAIRAATAGLTFETFRDTWTIRRSVEHGLLIITEASRSLPPDMKASHRSIPWGRLESLGNALRHEYQHIDPRVLWRIVQEQLPTLIVTARQMLADFDR